MSVGHVMSKKVRATSATAPLSSLRRIFEESKFQHVPVIDSMHRLVGIVSVKDYYKALAPLIDSATGSTLDVFMQERKVQSVMTTPVISVKQHVAVLDAAELLIRHNISALPVVDDLQRLIGIVSWKDILRLVVVRQQQKRERRHREEEE